MRYAEFPPSPRLAAYVRCIWTFEADAQEAGDAPQRIVPDGRPELVLHFGAPFVEAHSSSEEVQSRAVFAGQITRPLWLRPDGHAGVVGIRFHPAGARRFIGMPLFETTDVRVALGDLWPAQARSLVERMLDAADTSERVAIAEAFVAHRIALHDRAHDTLVTSCAQRIEGSRSPFAIDELVRETGVGRRQLERRFRDAIGIPPRLLGGILRFRSVFEALEHGGRAPWTDAALAAGYFDQSHLIRDFRRFVGCTPREFLHSAPGLSASILAD
jgi:AraC-like DNA-binding protein